MNLQETLCQPDPGVEMELTLQTLLSRKHLLNANCEPRM